MTLVGNPSAGGGILMRNAVNHGRLSSVVHIKEQDFYQIEASVNPGWSGGPVLDAEGKVVAIVAMKADDQVVAEIRGSMGKLDQDFRTRIGRTAYNVGLTYGIPAGALAEHSQGPGLSKRGPPGRGQRPVRRQDLDRSPELPRRALHAPHADRTSLRRSAPRRRTLAHGKTAGGHHTAARPGRSHDLPLGVRGLAAEPGARRAKRSSPWSRSSEDRLDERINAVQASASLSDAVKRDLRTLAAKVRDANKFAEHPPTTYAAFSTKVKGFSHDFKEHLKRLAENLKEKDS